MHATGEGLPYSGVMRLFAATAALGSMLLLAMPATASTVFSDSFNHPLQTAYWCPGAGPPPGCDTIQPLTVGSAAIDPAELSDNGSAEVLPIVQKPWTDPYTGVVYPYRGAEFNGIAKQSYGFGTYSARLWLPCTSTGLVENWPAFWLETVGGGSEFDIAEGLSGHLHWRYHYRDPVTGAWLQVGSLVTTGGCGWHTYALKRTSTELQYFYDGAVIGKVTNANLKDGAQLTTAGAQPIFVNGACSHSWCDPTKPGTAMLVDWFKVTS